MDPVSFHRKYKGKLATALRIPLKDKKDLSLAYTPGVAEVSLLLQKNPEEATNLTLKGNTVAVVSDGSAVLGLGNIGPYGALPVMEGKAALFKKFSDIDAFPICLDTQDTEEIIRIVKAIAPNFGGINLEDIASPRCFEIEERLIEELDIPVMHDDQHGTAMVVLAALINALKVVGKEKEKVEVVINGVGAAGTAVAELLLEYGVKNIILCDSQGIISKKREGLTPKKIKLAELTNLKNKSGGLIDAIRESDVFIGVSSGNLVNSSMIKSMNSDAIIFAMANPVPEIMPKEALAAGAKVVASGRSDFDNQINNVLAFPGIFRGALDNNVKRITNKMLIAAAINLAGVVKNPTEEKIIPSPFDKGVVGAVSAAIK